MRVCFSAFALGMSAMFAASSVPALADIDAAACAKTGTVVQQAVDARLAGDGKTKTRAMLTAELDAAAGAQLAEFIYSLPANLLTDDVAKQFEAQCKQM